MRHLGQEREVTTEQAVLDKRMLRLLYRQGEQVEGQLAGRCSLKMNAPAWRDAMRRLSEWGFVRTRPTGHGNSWSVSLTEEGKAWGEEIACTTNAEVMAEARRQ